MQFDGPWRKVAHDMYMMDGDEPIAVENAKGKTVCDNAPFYPTALDAKYADLIAAAPDLLHALLCLKEWVDDHAVKPSEISEMQTAIAAIAKAEGRA